MDNKKVLIVDDSSFMRMLLKTAISQRFPNINFIEADSGEKAIDKYKEYNPDLVFLDITLPGISGLDTLKQIQSNAMPKVIMCSSMGQKSFVLESIQLGASDFIVKPFKPSDIISCVNKNLSSE